FVLAKGLAEYRSKDLSIAVASLEKALTMKGRALTADVCIHSLLAMSHFRLDDKEAAAASLAEAEKTFNRLPKRIIGKSENSWHDDLIAETLLREARKLIATNEKAASN
ncbi:MAG: hypothetical protein H8E37_12970, partial [Planctomycetes bacterium]|nr:hypothetical protein [Planctomycetota bacterium]